MSFKQCKLKKKNTYQTSWIHSKFAKKGKYLKLKGEDGWKVVEVYSEESTNSLKESERDYKNHRKATDI